MAIKVNDAAVRFARSLIKNGKYKTDMEWSQVQPSAQAENDFLEKKGWGKYSKWYLAINSDASEKTKKRYEFPYGDFKNVQRSGLIAAKHRAGQYYHREVEKAADKLLQMIDKK